MNDACKLFPKDVENFHIEIYVAMFEGVTQ